MDTLRDEIVNAFVEVQSNSNLRSWLPADSKTIHENVEDTAKSIVRTLGDDWNNPDCFSLIRLIGKLVIKCQQWGPDQVHLYRCTARLGELMDQRLEERSQNA